MSRKLKTYAMDIGSVLLVFMLSACGNLSTVNEQGAADELVWPDAAQTRFDSGSYPDAQDLRAVRAGMTKDQLYGLLGRPHFDEGLFGVREWDYLFHFRTPSGDLTCQYKVLFDKNKIAQNFYWNPRSCADALRIPASSR